MGEEGPGTLHQILEHVEEAMAAQRELREQQQEEQQQQDVEQDAAEEPEEGGEQQNSSVDAAAEEGRVAAAVAAAATTLEQAAAAVQAVRQAAGDVGEVLARVRRALEEAEARRQQEDKEGGGGGGEGEGGEVWVHHGFLAAYDSIRPQLLALLDAVMEGEHEPWDMYLTGHSLGGALATLCAYDCALRG